MSVIGGRGSTNGKGEIVGFLKDLDKSWKRHKTGKEINEKFFPGTLFLEMVNCGKRQGVTSPAHVQNPPVGKDTIWWGKPRY